MEADASAATGAQATGTGGNAAGYFGRGIRALHLSRIRSVMNAREWESQLIPLDALLEVRHNPGIDKYDFEIMLLAEDWTRHLSLLEGGYLSGSLWPLASIHLNHVIRRCHEVLSTSILDASEPRDSNSGSGLDNIGQGDVLAGLRKARVVICELSYFGFGIWVEHFYKEGYLTLAPHQCSFNVDFEVMGIEWIFIDDGWEVRHQWIVTSLDLLFPGISPEELRRRHLRREHQQNRLRFIGEWAWAEEEEEEDIPSELDLGDHSWILDEWNTSSSSSLEEW
ncbi:hypothetical protein GGS24DRAFT_518415 [Hypoxylon argillaceum]|nr:hypothetical protein GGS24DRAFT_518415 [Hypoxylon argillaceum]